MAVESPAPAERSTDAADGGSSSTYCASISSPRPPRSQTTRKRTSPIGKADTKRRATESSARKKREPHGAALTYRNAFPVVSPSQRPRQEPTDVGMQSPPREVSSEPSSPSEAAKRAYTISTYTDDENALLILKSDTWDDDDVQVLMSVGINPRIHAVHGKYRTTPNAWYVRCTIVHTSGELMYNIHMPLVWFYHKYKEWLHVVGGLQ